MRKDVLLSEEVRELIHCRPHWIIRRGNLFFLLLLVGLVAVSWLIRVPAVVHGPLQLSVKNGQYHVEMKISGAITIRPNQRITIRLNDPAVAQWAGSVESISRVSSARDSCLLDLRITEPPATREGKILPLDPMLLARAEVVIADQRLFDRWWGMARLWYR